MNKILVLIGLGCMVFSGCATCKDCQYEMVQSCHACWGWHQVGAKCNCSPYPKHYRDGWKAGYKDVAMGGCGLLPPVPPEKYWKARYENCEGQKMVEAWYQGFGQGAVAAEKRCEKTWHPVPTSGLVALPPNGCSDCGCTTTCPNPTCCGPQAPVAPETHYYTQPPVEAIPPTAIPTESPHPPVAPSEPQESPREQLPPAEPTPAAIPEPEEAQKSSTQPIKPKSTIAPAAKPLIAQELQVEPAPVKQPQAAPVATANQPRALGTVAQPVEKAPVPQPSASSRITMVEVEKLFSTRIAKQLPQHAAKNATASRYAGYRPTQQVKKQLPKVAAQPIVRAQQPIEPQVKVPTLAKVKVKSPTHSKVRQTKIPSIVAKQSNLAPQNTLAPPPVIEPHVARQPIVRQQPIVVANQQKTKLLVAKPRSTPIVKVGPTKVATSKKEVSRQTVTRSPVSSRPLPKVAKAPQFAIASPVVKQKPTVHPSPPSITKPSAKLTIKVPAKEQPTQLKSSVTILSIHSAKEAVERQASSTVKSGAKPLKIRVASKALMLETPIRRDNDTRTSELRVVPRSQVKPIVLMSKYDDTKQSKPLVR